jgi:NAD/NADP transhydrogenase alpha subunit
MDLNMILITKEMIAAMPYGSVTVDLAAENGGNIETTVPGKTVQVTISVVAFTTAWASYCVAAEPL